MAQNHEKYEAFACQGHDPRDSCRILSFLVVLPDGIWAVDGFARTKSSQNIARTAENLAFCEFRHVSYPLHWLVPIWRPKINYLGALPKMVDFLICTGGAHLASQNQLFGSLAENGRFLNKPLIWKCYFPVPAALVPIWRPKINYLGALTKMVDFLVSR